MHLHVPHYNRPLVIHNHLLRSLIKDHKRAENRVVTPTNERARRGLGRQTEDDLVRQCSGDSRMQACLMRNLLTKKSFMARLSSGKPFIFVNYFKVDVSGGSNGYVRRFSS